LCVSYCCRRSRCVDLIVCHENRMMVWIVGVGCVVSFWECFLFRSSVEQGRRVLVLNWARKKTVDEQTLQLRLKYRHLNYGWRTDGQFIRSTDRRWESVLNGAKKEKQQRWCSQICCNNYLNNYFINQPTFCSYWLRWVNAFSGLIPCFKRDVFVILIDFFFLIFFDVGAWITLTNIWFTDHLW